jgi:hypothetical protein
MAINHLHSSSDVHHCHVWHSYDPDNLLKTVLDHSCLKDGWTAWLVAQLTSMTSTRSNSRQLYSIYHLIVLFKFLDNQVINSISAKKRCSYFMSENKFSRSNIGISTRTQCL